jgi:hypothetical protein
MTSPLLHALLSVAVLVLSVRAVSPQVVSQEVLQSVWVHDVPGPPQGDFWDSVTRSALGILMGQASIYPDVRVCVTTSQRAHACTEVCPNAQLDTTLGGPGKSQACQLPLGEGLPLDPGNPAIRVSVIEMDPGQRQIAVIDLGRPTRCTAENPCRASYATGDLVISFASVVQGVSGTLPAPAPPAAAPTAAPPPSAPTPSAPPLRIRTEPTWWERVGQSWDRLWDALSPADMVEGFCAGQSGAVLGWACGYFFGGPIRTMEQARENRIACLRGALGSGQRRQDAENACAAFPNGSGQKEGCLLKWFDDPPVSCMQGSDMQGAN